MSEINKQNENEKKDNVTESQKGKTNENLETNKFQIATLGNFVLAAFVVIIIGTGALTYYLIHTAKDDYDKQYNEIVSNLPENKTENEAEVDSIANIIDSAITEVTNQTSSNTTVTDGSDKKLMNESLVVDRKGVV